MLAGRAKNEVSVCRIDPVPKQLMITAGGAAEAGDEDSSVTAVTRMTERGEGEEEEEEGLYLRGKRNAIRKKTRRVVLCIYVL